MSVGCGAMPRSTPLDSGPVSGTGQALRRNDEVALWGAGSGTKGVVQGVVDLCDQPGGLGSVLGDGGGRFGKRPAVVVTGFGSRAWTGRDLLGAFAECSVGEDVGGGDAVVGGGLFVAVFGDVAQDLDELEAVVGHVEDGLCEVECRV